MGAQSWATAAASLLRSTGSALRAQVPVRPCSTTPVLQACTSSVSAERLPVAASQAHRISRSAVLAGLLRPFLSSTASVGEKQPSIFGSACRSLATTRTGGGATQLLPNFARRGSGSVRRQQRPFSSYDRYSYRQGGGDPDTALYGLIASNVAVFALWRVPLLSKETMYQYFTLGSSDVRQGRLLNIVTCAFSHNSLEHLFFNMLGLFVFGRPIAQLLGPSRLLSFYALGGVAGSIAHLVYAEWQARQRQHRQFYLGQERRILGASGAVCALTTMYIFMFPQATILIFGIVPLPSWLFGLIYIGSDVTGVVSSDHAAQSTVGHAAHLGGAAMGLACFAALRHGRLPF